MKNYQQHLNSNQTEKVPGVKKQKKNNAGGISFKISKWDYLDRFLLIGTEGGTYYVNERTLTKENCKNVQKCIDSDGIRTVNSIVDISTKGRSSFNDAAIFALALCSASDNISVKKYALQNLNKVCRTSTHLFSFIVYVRTMRGFGRMLREGVTQWYTSKNAKELAYQILKYKQRNGYSHRDVLRLCHAKTNKKKINSLLKYAVGKKDTIPKVSDFSVGAEKVKHETSGKKIADLIRDYRLTREVIPTKFLNDVKVWEALFESMPQTALIRNLGKMSSMEMHTPFSSIEKETIEKLTDVERLKKSRIHPINLLNALITYSKGHGIKGSLSWVPNTRISAAIEDAFYMSFNFIEPTNKNILIGVDVSGSMSWHNIPNTAITPIHAALCLSMVNVRTENNSYVMAFSNEFKELGINKNSSLKDAFNLASRLGFGATNCALPITYCIKNNINVDAIVIYTDNETYNGNIHPWQALDKLQNILGHEVKLIVCAMEATKFSIARPDYKNMLDICGFDSNVPTMISEFIK